MTTEARSRELRMIPIDLVEVMNPRERNGRVFEQIVDNIKTLGLKKPVTVTTRKARDGRDRFLLICGEGRLKAYKSLGATEIPAIVLQVNDEDALIMSLAENIARRQVRPLELLSGIEQLSAQGYDNKAIAEKTGLSSEYVRAILVLLKKGEERLLIAVYQGRIPVSEALRIAALGQDDKTVQEVLQEAYESGALRGRQLMDARRLVERRRTLGRTIARSSSRKVSHLTSNNLVRTYQREVERQKLMIRKAGFTQHRLVFVIQALRTLLADDNFTNLLRAEGLETLPKLLVERVDGGGNRL